MVCENVRMLNNSEDLHCNSFISLSELYISLFVWSKIKLSSCYISTAVLPGNETEDSEKCIF